MPCNNLEFNENTAKLVNKLITLFQETKQRNNCIFCVIYVLLSIQK